MAGPKSLINKVAQWTAERTADPAAQPTPQPSKLTPKVVKGARSDVEKTFKKQEDMDYNTKIRKWLGVE